MLATVPAKCVRFVVHAQVSKDAPSSGSRKHHPLLTAKKYQPTVKKSKLKPNERRPVLQLDSAIGGAQTVAEYQRMRGQHQDSVDVKPYVSKKQLPSSFTGDGAITSAPRHNGTCSQWSVPKMTEQFEKPTQEPVSNPASSGSTQACIRQKSKHKHKGKTSDPSKFLIFQLPFALRATQS